MSPYTLLANQGGPPRGGVANQGEPPHETTQVCTCPVANALQTEAIVLIQHSASYSLRVGLMWATTCAPTRTAQPMLSVTSPVRSTGCQAHQVPSGWRPALGLARLLYVRALRHYLLGPRLRLMANVTLPKDTLQKKKQPSTPCHSAKPLYAMLHPATLYYTLLHPATACYTLLHPAIPC